MTTSYELTIGHDEDTERPDENALGRMVSFNNRHINFQHPDEVDEDSILATLSYYEHGLCRWMVGESTVPDHGGFDTVQVAGVIVWNGAEDEREWWNGLEPDHKRKILDSIADEYTSWSNGDAYWYSFTQLSTFHDCPNCGGHAVPSDIDDSCGGFIGVDSLTEHLRDLFDYHGISASEVTIKGEAGYVLDNVDLEYEKEEGVEPYTAAQRAEDLLADALDACTRPEHR